MGLLQELKSKYKTVSIVGMAKNAGKTTALNYLIEEAMDEGLTLGITSTGRDGENTDLVTGTDKPKVYLMEGTIVSVPRMLYELSETGLEILKMTDYRTSVGEVLLCRVAESGYVQIAGPVITSDTKKMSKEMIDLGAELILIDGAIDRKSIAAPETSDAVIMSTGAVLSRSMKRVVEQTAHVIEIYSLETLEDRNVINKINQTRDTNMQGESKEEPIIIFGGEPAFKIKELNVKTGLGSGKLLDEKIDENTEYVYLPGAFTKSILMDISPKKIKRAKFIVKDPTKIFIDDLSWQQLTKKGLRVMVLQNICVAAITVNPFAPSGYSFDHKVLRDAMARAIPNIPVIDVRL